MHILNLEDFKATVKNTVLFAIDMIVRNPEGKILIGLRNNPPAKGYWFVPGGRVYKNETLNEAFERILKNEIGITSDRIASCYLKGLYEHIYEDNIFEDPSFNTHYIVAACEIILNENIKPTTDCQHEMLKFDAVADILKDTNVHQYTKNYFMEAPANRFLDAQPE